MGFFWTDVCNPLVGLYWSIQWVQPDELRLCTKFATVIIKDPTSPAKVSVDLYGALS